MTDTADGNALAADVLANFAATGHWFLGPVVPPSAPLVFFSAIATDQQREGWISDGTPAGTRPLAELLPGTSVSGFLNGLGSLENGTVLFNFDDGVHGQEPWITNGTAAGAHLFKDINPGPASSFGFGSLSGQLDDGRVVFRANDGTHGNELWVTGGTEAGTARVDALPASLGGFFGSVFGDGRVLYRAADGLYVTDASGAHRILDLPPSGIAREATTVGNGRVVFTSDAGGSGAEPWITDGTPGGTMLMADINSQGGSFPGGYLAFTEPSLL